MFWPDVVYEGMAQGATTYGRDTYGVPPDICGYSLADLRCKPCPDEQNSSGVYTEFGVAVVLSGTFEYRSEGQWCQAIPGALLFANRGEVFSWRHQDPDGDRRVVLFLSDDLIGRLAEDLSLDPARFQAAAAPPSKLTPIILGLFSRIARQAPDSYEAALSVAEAALQCSTNRLCQKRVQAGDTRRILDVVRYIDVNFAAPCSLDELASIAGMNRFRFARTFRAVAGETANRYVVNRRLCAAAARLVSTEQSVTEIAHAVGFNDISYFNARFRAAFACAPSVWRRLS